MGDVEEGFDGVVSGGVWGDVINERPAVGRCCWGGAVEGGGGCEG